MPRYEVSFERSAVQIRRVLIDAPTEETAVRLAITHNNGFHLSVVVAVIEEIYPDDESIWEHIDTEPALR
jgi:hypothetical protein